MKMESRPADDNPEVILLEVEGVVDSVNVTDFFQFVNKLFKDGTRMLVMDLSWANYLSSGALSVIADAFKKAESLGGGVVISNASDSLKEPLLGGPVRPHLRFLPRYNLRCRLFSDADADGDGDKP